MCKCLIKSCKLVYYACASMLIKNVFSLSFAGFESSQIFNLHIFASGIFGYLLNGKTTCIFDNLSLMNRNSEMSCCFKGIDKLTLSSLRLQLY